MDPEGVLSSAECKASEWSYWCEAVSSEASFNTCKEKKLA